jgi:putative hydrolase of the HAD superfamily
MKPPATVFCFDLDDTLVSEWDYVESGLRAAGALVDAEAPATEPAGTWLVSRWRRERARDLFQRLIRERRLDPEPWLQRLKDAYRRHEPVLEPRPGVSEVLGGLTTRGAGLSLVSDGCLDLQRRKWAALRLPFRFAPLVFTDEMGREFWKPHPWGFERVMREHPEASRYFYVADNPAKDFIAPNRLGWTTVMVRHARNLYAAKVTPGDAAPTITTDSLATLLDLF